MDLILQFHQQYVKRFAIGLLFGLTENGETENAGLNCRMADITYRFWL